MGARGTWELLEQGTVRKSSGLDKGGIHQCSHGRVLAPTPTVGFASEVKLGLS